MAALTHQQKKSLAGYVRTWNLKPGAEISILESATDRFCEQLLLDPPWNEIWTVNDVKNLIEETRDEAVRNANEQVLKNSDLLRRQIHDGLIAEIESYPALASLKIFVFYGLEIGLFERREIFRGSQVESEFRTTVHAAIHEIDGEDQISEKLPRDFENFLRGVTFSYSEDEEEFTSIQWRKLVSDLHLIVQFLSLLRSDSHAQRIAASIEWLIDSLVSTNQTLSLIQSCIGIEAILGDSTSAPYEVGITARLSERFAYLMGTSAENRRAIRDEFRAVFEKRGDLVHARRHRLPAHDLQIVHSAQNMLQQVIRKELSLVLDLPSNTLSHMNLMAIKRGMQPF